VHVIVAATDFVAREQLRAKVLQAGLPCDQEVGSSAMLERSLELRDPADPALVVVAQHEEGTLARLALGRGVPVVLWPSPERADLEQPGPERIAPRISPTADTGTPRRLSTREREVLALVAAGTSNKGIARSLRISPNTVKFHMTTLCGKLGVTTRAQAIAAAARRGELSL
jgi:DNA-binding CsgD family transcriptional regulator